MFHVRHVALLRQQLTGKLMNNNSRLSIISHLHLPAEAMICSGTDTLLFRRRKKEERKLRKLTRVLFCREIINSLVWW